MHVDTHTEWCIRRLEIMLVQIIIYTCLFIIYTGSICMDNGDMEWSTGLDMVLVEPFGHAVREEVIIRIKVVPLGSCPLHVLLLSAVPIPVVHQAQNQMDPALLCFGYHIVQTLS